MVTANEIVEGFKASNEWREYCPKVETWAELEWKTAGYSDYYPEVRLYLGDGHRSFDITLVEDKHKERHLYWVAVDLFQTMTGRPFFGIHAEGVPGGTGTPLGRLRRGNGSLV